MLPQFTKYLIQFHHVHIPALGTFRLVQQPATLDVAAKLVHPPHFEIQFSDEGFLSRHQLWHFGTQLHFDEEGTRKSLEDAGHQVRNAIEQQPLVWNGIGTLHYDNGTLRFEPQPQQNVLEPVAAERVLRERVQHSVLVGDQVVLSNGVAEEVVAEERHWNWSKIAGWAVLVLALFFILFFMYQHQFSPLASGMRQKLEAKPAPATYVQ